MKLNKGGLKCCAVYTGFFVIMFGLAYFSDSKGSSIPAGISVFPFGLVVGGLMYCLGLEDIPPESWLNSIYFFYLVSLVIMYFVGWTISRIARAKAARAHQRLLERLDESIHSDRA